MPDIQPIQPVQANQFGQLAQHRYSSFDVEVSPDNKDNLENPALWVHGAHKMRPGDEVRAVANDYSFVAYLFVTFAQGSDARLKLTSLHDLDEVEETVKEGKYSVKLRGRSKWCVMNNETGEVIKEGIPKQSDAVREMEEYKRALAA
jgi:hypothetical protein